MKFYRSIVGKAGVVFVLFTVLLVACDPIASKSVVIGLNNDKNSGEIVFRELNQAFSEAGFQQDPSARANRLSQYYEGDIADGERHTKAQIFVEYDKDSNQIRVECHQYMGSQLTPKMKQMLLTAEARLKKTGVVENITGL